MKLTLFVPSRTFSVAELSAMELNFEVFRFHDAYAPFGFIETPTVRREYLRLTHKKRARSKSSTALWVAEGGLMPEVLELVEDR